MSDSQDIPCRRVYIFRPNTRLLESLLDYGDKDLSGILSQPCVVMTEELPFEEHLEGWRAKIFERCKSAFISELLIENTPFKSSEEAVRVLGSSEPQNELVDELWEIEEADYIQINTDWKSD